MLALTGGGSIRAVGVGGLSIVKFIEELDRTYPGCGGDCRFRHDVVLHVIVKNLHQGVLRAAQSSEVVHIDSPGHGASVSLLLDPLHLVL